MSPQFGQEPRRLNFHATPIAILILSRRLHSYLKIASWAHLLLKIIQVLFNNGGDKDRLYKVSKTTR